jgi:large subunit ribosomal protein L19e
MNSTIQKKLAGKIAKRSPKKVKFDQSRLDEIKEAITRTDIRGLINDGAITLEKDRGSSKGRIRKDKAQRQRGRKKGQGSRKGKKNARMNPKKKWMNKIRLQRAFLKELKQGNKITQEVYKDLYRKAKGGFFRTKRHVKLYLTEHKLVK